MDITIILQMIGGLVLFLYGIQYLGDSLKKVSSGRLEKILETLTSNKWKIGHTFASSGALALEMAVLMLQYQQFLAVPYLPQTSPRPLKKILVNATGFGGNAVSVLLSLPQGTKN